MTDRRRSVPRPRKKNTEPREGTVLSAVLSRAGVCSRRMAKDVILAGRVEVDGVENRDPAFRVLEGMRVKCDGKSLTPATPSELVYIAYHKPAGLITSCKDDQGRLTVVDAVRYKHLRLFPVGRLDMNTTGLLLLTNDGDFAHKAMHPSFNIKKTYHVTLMAPITDEQLERLRNGAYLHDGRCKPDTVFFPNSKNRWVVGVEIHSGKYHVIRRLFYNVGCEVKSLMRVGYGSVSLRGIAPNEWKLLKRDVVDTLTEESVRYRAEKRGK